MGHTMPKRVLMQCSTQVDPNAVTRKTVDGVEHIVVSSYTLPDDVVMNGGLYPADEIAKSFKGLERTLAPVEHPTDAGGGFISASDPTAIHNFYAGAFNENVRQEGGRVRIDKVINVPEALKSERGRRLLDRITELETNASPRPVHTSTGVFLEVEELSEPRTNASGAEYTWIAHNMVFDHDAILLDSVGAAQPHDGVGMAVNRAGDKADVQKFALNADITGSGDEVGEVAYEDLRELLYDALNTAPLSADWVVRTYPSRVIYELNDLLFTVPYVLSDLGAVTISGVPTPVDREVTFTPKTNHKGNAMKALMLQALAAAGITANAEMPDDEVFAKYNELLKANQTAGEPAAGTEEEQAPAAPDFAGALQPILDRLDGIESKQNASVNAEVTRLADVVGNSDKYAGLTAESAAKLDFDTLKTMAANCGSAFGVPLHTNDAGGTPAPATFDMPE